jgi:two-component system, NtrC family, sensor histidine kinase KinB
VQRAVVHGAFERADALLTLPAERAAADAMRREVDDYHGAGDALVADVHDPGARIRYHEQVNPLLRRAVAETTRIRDDHFHQTQEVAAWARDQSTRATQILAAVFVAALLLSLVVAFYLARVVVLPIGELTSAVEAVRRGDFARRVVARRRDELGQLATGFNRMADDLAEFRRANIGEVIRAKETLEATIGALPDAVVVIEPGGEVSSANPRASAVIQTARGATTRHVGELPLPEAARAAVEACLRGEEAVLPVDLSKAIAMQIDGKPRKLLPRIVPIDRHEGMGRGAVLVFSDVTELARLDEMRMELVAVASHELRTPLTTLRMTLLMLQERAARLDERDRELVATALVGVEQLAVTVAEFLDLTRIEAGQLRLHWDVLDAGQLVSQAVATWEPRAEEARVALHTEVGGRLPLRGDAARLGVVLSNILNNALKYTPNDGTIRVRVGSLEVAGDRPRLEISISDSGPGIPEEFRDRVFEKFFRVEHHRPGTEGGVRGAGIGLYMAREIVEAHGGSVTCREVAGGRGASFVIVLPAEAS